ncbi:murein transglycosylase A [Amorphus sp. MBR-141]
MAARHAARRAVRAAIVAAMAMGAAPMPASAVTLANLPGWSDAPMAASFAAFRRNCATLIVEAPAFGPACQAQSALPDTVDDPAARAFFETWFRPVRVGDAGSGFLTGYFEPEIAASRVRSPDFQVPVYRRPADLVDVDPSTVPAGFPAGLSFARRTAAGLVPYPDRAAINAGALAGRGLELAFLADPVDAFFMQVQGSARLRFADGSTLRVNYAGKTGHPYTAIGRIVIDEGHIPREALDYARLRAWLKAHPADAARIMERNRSYIFFAPVEGLREDDGPLGAAGFPLIAEVSLAVDPAHNPFGTPIWIDARLPASEAADAPFRRLMVAEDRGSAILGAARGDVFFGSGEAAGARAGRIRHGATFYRLVPVSGGAPAAAGGSDER